MAATHTPADTRAKPPLEVVALVLAVDSCERRSGFALGDDAPYPRFFRRHASSDFASMQLRHCAFGSQPRWAVITP